MTINSLEIFLNWMTQHTIWVYTFIFIIAMSESLLVVGLIVPGFLLMVGFGALIATGHLAFWPTALIATAGAIAGDGLSYWLGRHYQQQIQRIWPLSRYPKLIQQGKDFFKEHGKKSVVFGRFFGPLRAIVPTIAGMSNMPPMQFYLSNVLSAVIWAPLYLLPGIIFGMSLQLAKEFAGQLAFLIVVAITLTLLIIHIVRTFYGWITPQADVLSYRLIIWARKHPILGSLPNSLVNPNQSEVRAITSFGFLLVISGISLILFNHYIFNTLLLNNIDVFIAKQFVFLQHPLATASSSFINIFNNHNFIFSIVVFFSLIHIYLKRYKPIFFLVSALILPWAFLLFLGSVSASFNAFSHQNYNTSNLFIITVSVYGYIATQLASTRSEKKSQLIYIITFLLLSLIAFSQLYSAQQSFSVLLGHFLFGVLWVAILSIAYRQHPASLKLKSNNTFIISTLSVVSLIAFVFVFYENVENDKKIEEETRYILSYDGWLESGWSILPAYRNDIRGYKQTPLNIQWVSSKTEIIEILNNSNWQQVTNTMGKYSNWFNDISQPINLPVVKHLHNGIYNTLTFIKATLNNKLMVIRLWPSNYFTKSAQLKERLWYGEIALTQITKAPFVNYLTTINEFNNVLTPLITDLNASFEIRERTQEKNTSINWDGKIILIK